MPDKKVESPIKGNVSNIATSLAILFGKQKKIKSSEIVSADSQQAYEITGNEFQEWERSLGASEKKILRELPQLRIQKYAVFERMGSDPVIHAALRMHCNTALAYDEDQGEIITIKTSGDATDKQAEEVVDDLKQMMHRLQITDRLYSWGLDTLKFGLWPIRVYGERGKGITNITSNAMTHPSTLKIYERDGQIAGYVSRYQTSKGDDYELLPPWTFVTFRMQGHSTDAHAVPMENYLNQWDLGTAKPPEQLLESWNYGQSILEGSFLPWVDLQESILALNMARRNKSKRDRMIAYPVGGQSPSRAAALTQAIAQRLKQRKQFDEEKRLAGGYIPAQDDFLLPYDTNGNGKIEFSTIEPNVDIQAIEDVMFHLKRICGALGLDPSLIGFGDMLSGGLGEGGWFRQSILAAATGEQLRRSISSGLNRLFEIHLAYKYSLVYPPQERPWTIQFHAASSAKEIENQQTRMLRMDLVDRLNQTIMAFKENGVGIDSENYAKYAIHDLLGIEEEQFEDIWKKGEPPAAEGAAKDFAGSGKSSSNDSDWDD